MGWVGLEPTISRCGMPLITPIRPHEMTHLGIEPRKTGFADQHLSHLVSVSMIEVGFEPTKH